MKIWTLDGESINTCKGHNGFVFGCCTLASGEIATASDDKSVKIWSVDGLCRQTIDLPGTCWSVTSNHLGDIVTGCEDYKVRTFTRDLARAGEGAELAEYEAECSTA
jgi:WD40 repeat protein